MIMPALRSPWQTGLRLTGSPRLRCSVEHMSEEQAVAALQPFGVLSTIRERMALPRQLFEQRRERIALERAN